VACGMQIDQLIAKMKASGVPGSIEAERILDQLLSADKQELTEAEGLQTTIRETGSERIST
jgi:hypothetical protein